MPMSRIDTERPTLLAWAVEGRLEEADIDGAAREALAAFDALGEVDVLIDLSAWEATEAAALFSRETASVQARSVRHIRRYAVIGAPGWAEAMIRGFGTFLPLEAKTFAPEEADAAWEWVGREAPTQG